MTVPPHIASTTVARRTAAGFALVGIAAFMAAAWIDPYDAAGRPLSHGTHRQLGLPPCMLDLVTGLPCPACGVTTSVALLAHGDVAAAWHTNWAGAVIGLLGAATTLWLAACAAGLPVGRWSAEVTICALVIAGAILATVRYVALVANWLLVA